MQFSYIYALFALAPAVAIAGPVAAADPVADAGLLKRGIDICPPTTGTVGQSCPYGSGNDSPHICSAQEASAILACVNGKWAIERRCGGGKSCYCTSEKDIDCRL